MLTSAERARLIVVLAGARNPQNIGAAARAMQDFGFTTLRFVNDFTAPFEAAQLEAVRSAVGAADVMRNAQSFPSLAEALADCTLAVGTTALGARTLSQRLISLAEAAPEILTNLAAGSETRVALLFGSEKTGLTNDQLSHCAWLTTIPMFQPEQARHLSMNLGQSVAVCLYELARGGFDGARELPPRTTIPATGDDRERLTHMLLDLMQASGYARRFPANSRENVVRQLALRLSEDRAEAQTWMGLLKQIARQPPEDE